MEENCINDLLKVTLIFIGIFIIQSMVYWGTQFLVKNPHMLGSKLDDKIPFIPVFIFPYVIWFVLLFTIQFILYFYSLQTYALYVMSLFIVDITSGIIYLVYPTTFIRPEPEGDSFSVKVVRFIYSHDKKILSCLPSLHCSLSTLFILSALYATGLPLFLKLIIIIFSLLVIVSTVFVKQHVIIDVITAIPLAVISWYIAMAIGADTFLAFFNFLQ
ncbi:MAG: PAP2 superfamily protein [Firmicutes bacterium ADurb.Bin099]|nr:MAG: PAP2 superfamily protein [Firmicutes bacterium ADurb.Bin099]